jgi:ferrous iron transport protein A
MSIKLSQLSKPQKNIQVLSLDGPESVRLMEMGITPGTSLDVVKTAPLGFPIEIKIRGYSLSLRKAEADCVILKQ